MQANVRYTLLATTRRMHTRKNKWPAFVSQTECQRRCRHAHTQTRRVNSCPGSGPSALPALVQGPLHARPETQQQFTSWSGLGRFAISAWAVYFSFISTPSPPGDVSPNLSGNQGPEPTPGRPVIGHWGTDSHMTARTGAVVSARERARAWPGDRPRQASPWYAPVCYSGLPWGGRRRRCSYKMGYQR